MSFFSKVFGGKKESAAPSTAEAIQKLRETEDMLIKKQDFLETKIENEMMIAKKNASKNKRAEQQDVAREISDAISNPVAFGQDADEDELEKELEELQQEQLDEELLGIPQHDTTTDELPAVPTSVPAVPSKTRT
ncbi:hypothetical protein DMN91_008590, partial [Ooceraea biroi]